MLSSKLTLVAISNESAARSGALEQLTSTIAAAHAALARMEELHAARY